jgi:hypothetical protein
MDPPKTTAYSFKEGDKGTGVYALQKALNGLNLFSPLVADGAFGPRTKSAVKAFQDLVHILSDGIAGPRTQSQLAHKIVGTLQGSLPSGLLFSIVEGESGCFIAAVNWSVAGGVDCGLTQRRVLGPPFDDAEVKRAFDSQYEVSLLRTQLHERFDTFRTRAAVHTDERAWRLACLAHNYPAGADRISRTEYKELSSYWTTTQSWVVAIGAKFPTGESVKTPYGWCAHYSLGDASKNELGVMTKYVDWS